jgi:hypothetical protein
MPKVRKTPSLSSLPRNDLNIPSARQSHHRPGLLDLVIRLLGQHGPLFSGCGRLFNGCNHSVDLPSHLQHYIYRRVGVKLPQHLLLLYCCAAEKFDYSRSLFTVLRTKASSQEGASEKIKIIQLRKKFNHQMARVRSIARVTRDEEEAEAAGTTPISEVMRQSGLVILEGTADKDVSAAKAEQTDIVESEAEEEDVDDYSAVPSKPSHLDFGKSTVSEADMPIMIKLGYFGEAEKKLVRFGREETTPKPENNEVVVFRSFFKAGLRFPLHEMIADVLENFEVYLHQLTPNTIVRLSVFIWALRSQGAKPVAEAFCRVHELHYQTKAREDGLHENFDCYNFAYHKDMKTPVVSYRTKWPSGWKTEWFYIKIDEQKEKLVQSP